MNVHKPFEDWLLDRLGIAEAIAFVALFRLTIAGSISVATYLDEISWLARRYLWQRHFHPQDRWSQGEIIEYLRRDYALANGCTQP